LLDWTNVRNQRWNPLVERTGIKSEREKAGLDAAVPCLTRHTHQTTLKDSGVSPIEIAARGGHTPQVSAEHYQKATAVGERLALEATLALTLTPKRPVLPS
jgi:hypothetical protein